MSVALFDANQPPLDTNRRFVRFIKLRPDFYVEFFFSIGDPALGVDLILPQRGYEEFCAINKVTFMTEEQAAVLDFDNAKWRFGSPGIKE